ncbi:transposase-like protein [Weissella uvarum]|nr:transposase-like protein [Weissella uvarum]MCM0595268.1 transposase [Weissella uvarum]
MKNSSGKRYSNDFKERIVKLYLNGHQSMIALSYEYGVKTSNISNWAKLIILLLY